MKKAICILMIIINILFQVPIYAEEQKDNYSIIIEDDADLLTTMEEELLKNQMLELTNYGNILFKSINKNQYASAANYASQYYHSKFGQESGTLFLIDMDTREIYVFSDGNNYNIITKTKAEIITDNIYKYASKKEYYTCASKAYEQILTLLNGDKIAEPMKYICNILLAIMISQLINIFIIYCISKTSKRNILKNAKIYVKNTSPDIKFTNKTKIYSPIETSSGDSWSGGSSSGGGWSGGSSSSGGSSGGGSSGGGGGHSF